MKPLAHSVVLYDAGSRCWLDFRSPLEVLVARTPAEVASQLLRVEAAVGEGLHAAGFLAYEAAPAFDPAFAVRDPGDFPLGWFGLYRAPEVLPGLPPADPDAYSLEDLKFSIGRERYLGAIAAIKSAIREGETYQVNFTTRVRGHLRGDPWDCFLGLAALQQADYCAYLDTGTFTIVSASPECFFELEGDTLTCRPMKGTRPRGRWHDEDMALRADLASATKDRAENVMIVDMVRNDLGRIARSGSVRVERLFEVERYPTVWQLTSTVKADSDAPLTTILGALFPCASITGAPKHQTMGIISRLEDSPRLIYTGSVGFVAPGRRAQFNVAIRTLLVDNATGNAEYGTGGGIVWDSVPAEEYRECQVKSAILSRRPQAFSLLESLRWEPATGYFLLDGHIERLEHSAAYFGFPLDVAALHRTLEEFARGLPAGPQKVRLTLRRAGETRLEAEALPDPPPGPARLGIAAGPVDTSSIFLYHKTSRREPYERARESCPDCDDVLLWNERREVTETSVANLVLDLDGELVTPPVSAGLLPGVMRASLLARGVVRERTVRLDELVRCRRIYLVNSVRKWRQAVLVRGAFNPSAEVVGARQKC